MKEKDPLEKILAEIGNRAELIFFFEELMNPESAVPRIFLLHRQDLFPGFEQMDIVFPLIFWVNSEFEKTQFRTANAIASLKKFEEIKTTQAHDTFSFVFSMVWKQFKPLFSSIFEQNPELIKSLFQEELMGQKTEVKMPESVNSKKFGEQIKKRINLLISEVKNHPLRYFDAISNIWPDPYPYLHMESGRIINDIIKYSKTDFQSYQKVINLMFALKLIRNLETSSCCLKCPETVVLKSKTNLGPQSLELKCPICRRKMSISSIYKLDEFLSQLILSKDGLLGITVAWLLKKRKVEYKSPFFIKETELDFICKTSKGEVLMECKMYRDPPTERSVRQKIVNDLKQINDHVKAYEEENQEKIYESYLVYNFDLSEYQGIIDEKMDQYTKIFLIDFSELNEAISSFSDKES